MIRLLFLVLMAYLVYRGIASLLDQVRIAGGGAARRPVRPIQKRPEHPEHPENPALTETLVRCTGCGTHVLRSRSLTAAGGASYCSDECRRRAAQSA
jgi:hypothetical protein